MPNVVRFVLDVARDLHVPGVGAFNDGVLDVDANNIIAVGRARYLLQPYRAIEIGIVDSGTAPPTLPAPNVPPAPNADPYPQYLTQSESDARYLTEAAARGAFGSLADDNTWAGANNFLEVPTVNGAPIGGGAGGPIDADKITDATTVGKALVRAASQAAARTAIGAGTSSFSGAYGDLTGRPTIPAVPGYVLASAHGWATTNTPAQNDTAFAAAWTAAKAAKMPLYLGYGTFQVSAVLDMMTTPTYAGGVKVFGAGMEFTIVENVTNTSTLINHGGLYGGLEDFTIRHPWATQPNASTGDGLVFRKVAYSSFKRLRIENTGRAISIAQEGVPDQSNGANATRNWMFSCSFEDIIVFRYSKNALFLKAVDARSTGSTFTNLYLQNPGGTSSGYPVDLFQLEESTFNQLNIEDAVVNIGLLAVSCGNLVINGLHFERVGLTGWQPNYVRSFGSAGLVINGASWAFCDVATAGAQDHVRLFSVAGGGQIVVNGYSMNNLTKTLTALPFSVVEVDDVNAMNAVEVGYGVSNSTVALTSLTRTSPANPGLKRIGDQLYALGSGVRAQTKTAAYTLTAGDAGSVIEVNSGSAITITVPSAVLAPGAVVEVVQLGTGQVTLAAGSGMTLRTAASLTTRAQYATVAIRARTSSEAVVSGDLT